MNWLPKLRLQLRALFQKQKLDARMDDEMRSHIEMQTQENIEAGMKPEEARYASLRQFGRVETIKDTCREQRGVSWIENLSQDVRYGARMLRKNPGFTAVAVLTLALGIGANNVVLSVAKAVLFRSFGFEESERLVWIRMVNAQAGSTAELLSWPDIGTFREETKSFEALAAFGDPGANWEQGDRTEELAALRVTASLADVLRIRPALGRMLLPSDEGPAAAPVVMVSHELWQTRFGGRPDILGQTLRLNETVHTVVGVLPQGLEFPLRRAPSAGIGTGIPTGMQDFWFPESVGKNNRVSRGVRIQSAIGRLKEGVSLKSAQAELTTLGNRLAADFPESHRGWNFELVTFRDWVFGKTQPGLVLLAVAVVAVLLICCVNLANLLLARGVARQREWAVRSALGAGRGRIVRALLTESVLLSLLGGGLGVGLAAAGIQAIRTLGSTEVPFIEEATIDGTMMLFTLGLSFATAFLFGLVPALRQSRIEASDTLRSGSRASAGLKIRTLQHSLLVGQMAVVLALLTSAGLLLESFRRLMKLDLGYAPSSVITLNLGFNTLKLPSTEDLFRLYRELQSAIAALPGVQSVGVSHVTPLVAGWNWSEKAQVFGRPLPEAEQPSLAATFVAFDYFQAMGIPLISGRVFRETELRADFYPPIAVLNEAAARQLFSSETALGKRFAISSSPEIFYEVVGVVKDTRDVRLEENPKPRFYFLFIYPGGPVVVRSSVPAPALVPMLRDAVQRTDPRITIQAIKPMTQIVSGIVAERRFLMVMLATYAGIALGIAGLGIFGVVAYQVAQRTNEFGVRLALGASPAGLVRLVLAQAGRLVFFGLLIGLLLSVAASRLLASQLFALSPHDPALLGSVSLLLLCIALGASFLPARRAAKVDPMKALRYE